MLCYVLTVLCVNCVTVLCYVLIVLLCCVMCELCSVLLCYCKWRDIVNRKIIVSLNIFIFMIFECTDSRL